MKLKMTFRILLTILIEICVLFKQQAAGLIQHAWRTFLQRRDIQRKEVFEMIFSFIENWREGWGYKFICPIFWLDKTNLHQGLEKLSENRINGYSIKNNTKIKIKWDWWRNTIDERQSCGLLYSSTNQI